MTVTDVTGAHQYQVSPPGTQTSLPRSLSLAGALGRDLTSGLGTEQACISSGLGHERLWTTFQKSGMESHETEAAWVTDSEGEERCECSVTDAGIVR